MPKEMLLSITRMNRIFFCIVYLLLFSFHPCTAFTGSKIFRRSLEKHLYMTMPSYVVEPRRSFHSSPFSEHGPKVTSTNTHMSIEEQKDSDVEFEKENICAEDRESDESSSEDNDQRSEEEADEVAQRRAMAARAALLGRKNTVGVPSSDSTGRNTSIGDRRVGSASKARQGSRATTRIAENLRKTAAGIAADKKKKDDTTTMSLDSTAIHSTVRDLLKTQNTSLNCKSLRPNGEIMTAPFSSFGRSIGILGEPIEDIDSHPDGVVLADNGLVHVRVATPMNDVDIANLRLSAFSEFSNDLQEQFCSRSCQAIASRRLRGAICLVAASKGSSRIVGSAECSYHEFFATKLGSQRPKGSILYITEVAVCPSQRRKGIGTQLLIAIDELAKQSGIETLYLHVDVKNHAAQSLYQKAGFSMVKSSDSMYLEFTTSLNLQNGATRGRDHFLLAKNFVEPTWLKIENFDEYSVETPRSVLGFKIPA